MTDREQTSGAGRAIVRLRWGWLTTMWGAALLIGLIWLGLRGTGSLPLPGVPSGPQGLTPEPAPASEPFMEGLKLVVAALIGVLVSAVHRPSAVGRVPPRSLLDAQILLCVSGALMMIVISGSLARAFGVFGGASIIRFRTPVDDPKDVTILFLLMGLGMATGIGAFAVAGVGTAFLCLGLLLLRRAEAPVARAMKVELVAAGPEFPAAHVQEVFARHQVRIEPRDVMRGEEPSLTYLATVGPETSLADLTAELIGDGGTGLRSVSWRPAKRRT